MKVFVSGATGVLGHRLVERLADRGHEVHGLARDAEGAALVEDRGGVPRRGDVLESASLADAVDDDVEAVVHAASKLPVKTKPTDEDWAANDRVRLEGTRNLLAAAGPSLERFYFPSVVWVARQPDGSAFDEESPRNPDRATESAAEVEDLLERRANDGSFGAAVLRCGFLYAPDAGHTRLWGRELLAGDMPVVGGGPLGRRDAELSLLHADDAARAFADAVDAGLTGRYHVVDGAPVTGAALLSALADRLDAPEPSRIPGWLARLFVGKVTARTFTRPMPTSNDRFAANTGWSPRYPTYREGLEQVVETWLDDGSLREADDGYRWAGEE